MPENQEYFQTPTHPFEPENQEYLRRAKSMSMSCTSQSMAEELASGRVAPRTRRAESKASRAQMCALDLYVRQ
eukprot:2958107-Prymnesium_polylepis.1